MSEWHYIVEGHEDAEVLVWARADTSDPYGYSCEVLLFPTSDDLGIRVGANDCAPHQVSAFVAAPIRVIAEVLRRAGWTVTPPKEEG